MNGQKQAPAMSKAAPKPAFPRLQPLLAHYMGMEQRYDYLNNRNAYRWYCIALESLEKHDHARMRKAVSMLAGLATANGPNRHEAREYLVEIMKNPGSTSYAADMLRNAASDAIGLAILYAEDPEAACRTLGEVMTAGMGSMEKLLVLNNARAEQLSLSSQVPKGERARSIVMFETIHKMIGELLTGIGSAEQTPENLSDVLLLTIVSGTHNDFAQKIAQLKQKWGLSNIITSD